MLPFDNEEIEDIVNAQVLKTVFHTLFIVRLIRDSREKQGSHQNPQLRR